MALKRRRGHDAEEEDASAAGGAPGAGDEPFRLEAPAPEGDDLALMAPLASTWFDASSSSLRVPTVAFDAEVLCADGRSLIGRIFVPATASCHAGATRPEEWMNEATGFFPFLPDQASGPMILNKLEMLVMTVPAAADAGDVPEGTEARERRVAVFCGGRRLVGTIVIDMPRDHSRVLDYLNRRDRFLTLRDGDRHHLIQKARITRVEEARD